jgi:hypothetical protein
LDCRECGWTLSCWLALRGKAKEARRSQLARCRRTYCPLVFFTVGDCVWSCRPTVVTPDLELLNVGDRPFGLGLVDTNPGVLGARSKQAGEFVCVELLTNSEMRVLGARSCETSWRIDAVWTCSCCRTRKCASSCRSDLELLTNMPPGPDLELLTIGHQHLAVLQ